jgi:preprotein translocase subunit SecE
MATRRQRGGPAPAAGSKLPEGGRLVTPAVSKQVAERMRAAMAPPARPVRRRLFTEQLNAEFFREAWGELKKVHWPTWTQARNLTALVIGVSLVVGMILGGVDYVLSKIFQFILGT